MGVMYAKSGGGNFSAASTWSATGSGGADSVGPPLASTDVIFESGSGAVTIDAASVCRSLNCTSGTGSYTGTLTHNAFTLSIGDGTAGAGNVALKFSSGMTYTRSSATASSVTFVSTSATQQSITTAGKTLSGVTINGSGGSWQLQDALTLQGTWTWTAGTLDTNSKIITMTGSGQTFNGGGQTYYELDQTMGGTGIVAGTNTFTNLTRTGTASKTDLLCFANSQTINGLLTINGNSATNRLLVYVGGTNGAATPGTTITLTTNSPTVTNADFQDITASGTGWDLHAVTGLAGDCGGNSGMTLTTGVPQYWHTGTTGSKTWSTVGNWFLATNGGGGAGRVPLPQDNVFFDLNAIGATSTTIVADMPRLGANIDWTGVTNSPTFAFTSTSNAIFGSLTLVSGMTISGTQILTFSGRNSCTITNAGRTFTQPITIAAPGGTYALQDALISNGALQVNNGTFDAKNGSVNANVTVLSFSSATANTRTITMGTGTWTLTGNSATIWNTSNATNLTLNRGNAVVCNYSGSTGTRSISASGTESQSFPFAITAGSDTFTITNSSIVQDLDFTGFTGTTTNNNFTVYGNLTMASGMTLTAGASTVTFAATSGTKTITSNGNTLDFPITISGVGGTWKLGDNLTVGSTRTITLLNGTLDANNHNFSLGLFSSNNSNTRTLTMGSGTWSITGNAATVWNMTTTTGLTLNANTSTVNFTYSGSTGTRTIIFGGPSFSMNTVKVSAGSDTVTFSTNQLTCVDLDFTGFTGTKTAGTHNVSGNLTLGTGMTFQDGSGLLTMQATSGIKTITTNGATLGGNLTFDGVGGTWQLADNLLVNAARTLTLTNGTFDCNGHNLSAGIFSSSNSNARTFTMGAGQCSITGNAATVIAVGTVTNFTLNRGSNPLNLTYSGSTGTRTISFGATGATETNCFDIAITAGSDTVNASGSSSIHNLDFTGFTGTWSNNNFFLYGNLTVASGMTVGSGASSLTLAATSGTKTITTNGKTLDFPIIFNGIGGTFQLADNFTGGTTRTYTLTNGTFDTNNKTVNIGAFATSNSNTRTLKVGTAGINLNGTGTVFSCTNGSNLTVNQTGPIVVTDTSSTAKTWSGGNPATWWARFTGDNVQVTGSNVFSTLNLNNAGLPNGTLFQAGFSQTITTSFTTNSSAGNLCIINSTTTGTHTLNYTGTGKVSVDYMNIQHSIATPGSTWYAGIHSVNNQAVATAGTGWIFGTQNGFFNFFN